MFLRGVWEVSAFFCFIANFGLVYGLCSVETEATADIVRAGSRLQRSFLLSVLL